LNLSASQIAQYAAAAGFSGNDLATAVAIAMAESQGGNPNAYFSEPQDVPGHYGRLSPNDGLGSYGLWQIYLAAHPEFAGENLLDPQTNANAAYSIYAIAGGFTPWSTYTQNLYQQYMPAALTAAASLSPVQASAAPLVLDAATGQPIAPADVAAMVAATAPEPSLTDVLLLGGLAIFALWIYAEA
jgi:hypothetical protein